MTAVMPEGVTLARDLVGPAMESAIARLTPDVRAVAAYHLGFADAAGNPTRNGSGKALRPKAGTRLPGLVLAGAWTDTGWPDTMEGAVRSGHPRRSSCARLC